MAIWQTWNKAIAPIPATFFCVIQWIFPVTKIVANPKRISGVTIRILRNNTVATIPSTFYNILIWLTVPISNVVRKIGLAFRISLIKFDAVAPIISTYFRVVLIGMTFSIANKKRKSHGTPRIFDVHLHIDKKAIHAVPTTFFGVVCSSSTTTVTKLRWLLNVTIWIFFKPSTLISSFIFACTIASIVSTFNCVIFVRITKTITESRQGWRSFVLLLNKASQSGYFALKLTQSPPS
mmetsp:Transcript_19064/g.28566  ORF Transcript_19064/g.28566 Transcript_19064/m.28566 type:complete len:236 (-) Transcript_19064:2331-3038(-)